MISKCKCCRCNGDSFQCETRDYPEGEKGDDWKHKDFETPIGDGTILMMHKDYDVPPWTGYYDDRYIAYETRLPISVSHWKYVE